VAANGILLSLPWMVGVDSNRFSGGARSMLKAVLTDIQFWIPVAVLAAGIVLLVYFR
jgi:hypothetical protein